MTTRHTRLLSGVLLAGGLFAGSLSISALAAAHHVEIERCGLMVFRNDLVAYHATSKAVPGQARFKAKEDGATFWFASAENLRKFRANPDRYMPRFSKFCRLEAKKRKPAGKQ